MSFKLLIATKKTGSIRKSKGFTLLEVLIAMVIFGTTISFLLGHINQQQKVHTEIAIKTVAHWVAMNKIAETRMEKQWPKVGVTRGEVEMRGTNWYWLQTVTKTSEKKLRQVEVEVRLLEDDENAASRFVGFIGEKSSASSSSP